MSCAGWILLRCTAVPQWWLFKWQYVGVHDRSLTKAAAFKLYRCLSALTDRANKYIQKSSKKKNPTVYCDESGFTMGLRKMLSKVRRGGEMSRPVFKWTQRRDGGECIRRGWRGRRHYNVPFKYNEGGEDGLIALWDYPAKADRGEAERDERCNDRCCWQCKSPHIAFISSYQDRKAISEASISWTMHINALLTWW